MTNPTRAPGDRVRITTGKWVGRTGTLTAEHRNPGSPGGQQSQSYPVVNLDEHGRKKARTIRVLTSSIEPID